MPNRPLKARTPGGIIGEVANRDKCFVNCEKKTNNRNSRAFVSRHIYVVFVVILMRQGRKDSRLSV